MSRLPIRVRLTLVFAVVMALVLTALGAFLYVRLGASLDERIADDLESRSTALANAVLAGEAAGLDPSLLRSEDGIVQVLRADGSSLFPSGDPILEPEELARARRGSLTFDVGRFRLHAEPVGENVIVVGESLEDRDEALDALLAQLLVALPIALLFSLAIGYFVAGAALRPVDAMRRRAAEISADTAERRLPLPRANDEISRLGETLNEMLDRLDAGLERERRFVADASHELRTPLAALRTELELAARRPRTQAELEAALGSAREEVERLVRLAEDLLVLARADEGALVLDVDGHDVRAVLDAVAARYDTRAAIDGRALMVAAPAGLVVLGDRRRLERALDDLVDNAFSHGAGTVRLDGAEMGDAVMLSVSDEGPGFPTEFLPHAFERFTRADAARTGGGAGLGLAIVDAVARAHGGRAVASNRDGAAVSIAIPAHRQLMSPP